MAIRESIEVALKQEGGAFLILNVDDSEMKFDELYDPDIKEYYGNGAFLPQLWNP
jgi:hypothetical protein